MADLVKCAENKRWPDLRRMVECNRVDINVQDEDVRLPLPSSPIVSLSEKDGIALGGSAWRIPHRPVSHGTRGRPKHR